MIRLDNTVKKVQALLAGTVTANQLPITVFWSDKTASAYTGGMTAINTNNVTAVDICGAPGASTIRDIDTINVYNADTAAATITIRYYYDATPTYYTITKVTLASGDTLRYSHGEGWAVLDANGNVKLGTPASLISDDTTTNATYYPVFVTSSSGSASTLKTSSSKLSYNPSTGVLAFTNAFYLNANQTLTAAKRNGQTALTSSTSITPDFNNNNDFTLTLAHNATLNNPSNLTAGQGGVIVITQDGTGNRTMAFGTYYKFEGGTAPTLTTTANAVDVLAYYAESTTRITCRLMKDVK